MLTRYVGLGDTSPRDAYVAWAESVKRNGGVVTNAPHYPDNVPAARYPTARVFPNAPDPTLGAGFTRMPDDWTLTGEYVYYLAPENVSGYAATGMLQAQAVPGEPPPANPNWFENLKSGLGGIGREVVIGVAVTVGVAFVLNNLLRKR